MSRYRDTQLQLTEHHVICESEIQVPIYISVSRLEAYFTVNSSLSGVIQVLIKHRMSTAADISALGVSTERAMVFKHLI